MGGRTQSVGVCGPGEEVAATGTEAWSGDQGASPSVIAAYWLLEAAVEDDALWRMAGAGFGNCVGASGGSGATPGRRALRLCGDALGPSEGGSPPAFALHRIKRRLATICNLVSAPNPDSPKKGGTTQDPHGSTANSSQGRLKKVWGNQLHPIA